MTTINYIDKHPRYPKELLLHFPTYDDFKVLIGGRIANLLSDDYLYNSNDSVYSLEKIYHMLTMELGYRLVRFVNYDYFYNLLAVDLADYLPKLFIQGRVILKRNISKLLNLEDIKNVSVNDIIASADNTINSRTDSEANDISNSNVTQNNQAANSATGAGDANPGISDDDFFNNKTINIGSNQDFSESNSKNMNTNKATNNTNTKTNSENNAYNLYRNAIAMSLNEFNSGIRDLVNHFNSSRYFTMIMSIGNLSRRGWF